MPVRQGKFAKRPANAPAKLQNKNTTAQSTLGDTGSLTTAAAVLTHVNA